MKTTSKIKKSRFTMTELAVIIAILVCLIAVLGLLGLSKARESRCRISCVSNLKHIGLSMRMYSNVYGEQFPHPNGRSGLQMLATHGFLENTQVYICPSTRDYIANSAEIWRNSSYCYAGGLSESDSVDSAIAADRAHNHSKFGNILFIDGHVKGYAGTDWTINRGGSVLTDFK